MDPAQDILELLAGYGPWLQNSPFVHDEISRFQCSSANLADGIPSGEPLRQWLETLQSLHSALAGLNVDADRVLDHSTGQLCFENARRLRQCAEYLRGASHIQGLAALLQQMRLLRKSHRSEIQRRARRIHGGLPRMDSRREMPVLAAGQCLEQLLPGELSLLADPDLELLFDLRLVERQLLGFSAPFLDGADRQISDFPEPTADTSRERGPLIICVDTSEAMHGAPETLAKAISLAMATRADQECRAVYLMNVSATVEVMDLSAGFDLMSLLDFLSWSFRSGSDVVSALRHVLRTLDEAAFGQADVLVISDFVMAALPPSLLNAMQTCRHAGQRFFAMGLGDLYLQAPRPDIFDGEWIFNPGRSSLMELEEISRRIFK